MRFSLIRLHNEAHYWVPRICFLHPANGRSAGRIQMCVPRLFVRPTSKLRYCTRVSVFSTINIVFKRSNHGWKTNALREPWVTHWMHIIYWFSHKSITQRHEWTTMRCNDDINFLFEKRMWVFVYNCSQVGGEKGGCCLVVAGWSICKCKWMSSLWMMSHDRWIGCWCLMGGVWLQLFPRCGFVLFYWTCLWHT